MDDLYLIESPALKRIKIGRSEDVLRRLRDGATFCPDPDLRILAVLNGCGDRELEVHRAFARHHSHLEWFHDNRELREWIDGGCDLDNLPQQFVGIGMASDVAHHHSPAHIEALYQSLCGGVSAQC